MSKKGKQPDDVRSSRRLQAEAYSQERARIEERIRELDFWLLRHNWRHPEWNSQVSLLHHLREKSDSLRIKINRLNAGLPALIQGPKTYPNPKINQV